MSVPSASTSDPLVTHDGLTLATRQWTPNNDVRAVVLLVHGYAEHSGRYEHVAEAFLRHGAAVHTYDQRGHGRSEGPRAYVDGFEQYVADLHLFHQYVRDRTPDVPVFLFGHSMGGLVALLYVLNRRPNLRGLLLSSPALEVNPSLAPFLRRMAQLLGRLFPTLPTARSPQGDISRDPDVVEEAQSDPLNYHGRMPARTGAELLRAGEEARSRLLELDCPFLVIHGTGDRLATPAWSQHLYERAAAQDKTLHLYDGLYHETFNEPEQDEVLADLSTWLGDRISTDSPPSQA